MAFLGMLGHLAHPVTTPVWGHDKCSFTPALSTQSGRHIHMDTMPYENLTKDITGMDLIFLEKDTLGFVSTENWATCCVILIKSTELKAH